MSAHTSVMCIRAGHWIKVEKADAQLRDAYGAATRLAIVDEATGHETVVELDTQGVQDLLVALQAADLESAHDYTAQRAAASDDAAPAGPAALHGKEPR